MKLLFPKQNYNVLSPRSYTHISVSDLYISRIGLPILLQEICGPILGIYKLLTDTWMWKLGLRPHNSKRRNTEMRFSLQCVVNQPWFFSSPHYEILNYTFKKFKLVQIQFLIKIFKLHCRFITVHTALVLLRSPTFLDSSHAVGNMRGAYKLSWEALIKIYKAQ